MPIGYVESARARDGFADRRGQRRWPRVILAESSELSSGIEPQAAMETCVRATARVLGLSDVVLWLHDSSAEVLRLGAVVPSDELSTDKMILPVEDSVSGSVLRSGQPFVTHQLIKHPLWKSALPHADPPQSGLFVPFFYRGRALGVVAAVSARERIFSTEEIQLVEALAAQVAVALENARLYENASRQARSLATILVVNKRLALGPQLDETLTVITGEAARLLGVEAAGLRLLEGDVLIRGASYGPAEAIMVRERLGVGESLSGRVVKEDRPILSTNLTDDLRHDPLHRAGARAQGLHAWLGVPLRGRTGVVGVLFVGDTGERRFELADIQMLEAFGDQAAIAIENARALHQEQERRQQVEAIRDMTAVLTRELDLRKLLGAMTSSAATLVDSVTGTVFLWDEGSQVLLLGARHGVGEWAEGVRLGLGEGIVGTAAARREAVIVNDYRSSEYAHPLFVERTSVTAGLAQPILYQGQLIGVMTVGREAGTRAYTRQDEKLLRIFADQAAIAIQNARLHEATNRRAEQLAAVNDLSRRLSTVLDVQELAREILVAVETLIPGAVGRFWERVSDDESLRLVSSLGLRKPTGRGLTRLSAGEGLMAIAAGGREPVCCRDVARDPRFLNKNWAAEEGLASCIFVPLVYDERVYGILSIFTRTVHDFSDDEVQLLRSFADHAAVAIENARLYRELGDREHRLHDLVGRLLLAQEEERRRVAYDVHDGLAQVAAAAHQHLEAFASDYRPRSTRTRQELDGARELAQLTVKEARRVIADLRPTALDDFGLAIALRKETEALRAHGWDITYKEALGQGRLPTTVETTLFRVAQEALENARKHAQTTRAHLGLERRRNIVRLEVRDWGRGFQPSTIQASTGPSERVGLPGMHERIAWLGGRCTIRSRPGAGTRIVVEVPLPKVDAGGNHRGH
jgi:GAF domain-containing protein